MKGKRAAAADWATIVLALCAIFMVGWVVLQPDAPGGGPSFGPRADEPVADWDSYNRGGHLLGPPDAAVVIVEFGDYECPFCQLSESAIRDVLEAFPSEVAVRYRHLPLAYHRYAYQAARLAECAADQGAFEAAHRRLYDVAQLSAIDSYEFGLALDLSDPQLFLDCASSQDPVPGIEADLADAEALGVTATPTFIVNGLRLGSTPDRSRLFELVEELLAAR